MPYLRSNYLGRGYETNTGILNLLSLITVIREKNVIKKNRFIIIDYRYQSNSLITPNCNFFPKEKTWKRKKRKCAKVILYVLEPYPGLRLESLAAAAAAGIDPDWYQENKGMQA